MWQDLYNPLPSTLGHKLCNHLLFSSSYGMPCLFEFWPLFYTTGGTESLFCKSQVSLKLLLSSPVKSQIKTDKFQVLNLCPNPPNGSTSGTRTGMKPGGKALMGGWLKLTNLRIKYDKISSHVTLVHMSTCTLRREKQLTIVAFIGDNTVGFIKTTLRLMIS